MKKVLKGLAKRRMLFASLLAMTIFGAVYGFAVAWTPVARRHLPG